MYELESIERPGHTLTRVRIATFLAGANQLYLAHIAKPLTGDGAPNAHFHEGSTLDVCFKDQADPEEKVWKFQIVAATPYTHAKEYAGYTLGDRTRTLRDLSDGNPY